MTLPSTPRRAGPFYGDGSATTFPFTFKTYAREDIRFEVTPASGDATVKVLDVDYLVFLNVDQVNNPGGYVQYPIAGSPLAVGDVAAIGGNLAYSQPTALPEGGAYRARNVETMADRIVMLVQQIAEAQGRSFTFPLSEGVIPEFPPIAERAGRLLGFDDAGQFIGVLPASGSAAALSIDLASASSAIRGPALIGYQADNNYPDETVGAELRRHWLRLDDFVSDTTGAADVAAGINAAIAAAVVFGAFGIYGNPGSTYRVRSRIDLTTARNLVLDFRGAGLIDDVRQFRADLGGRGDHLFRLYGSQGVTVCNARISVAATRAVLNTDAPSCSFWIGGQSEGNALTSWSRVENITITSPITGMMVFSILGEAAGIHIRNVEMRGRIGYGVNCEYGDVPVDPAVNNTITNGLHPYDILVEDVRGYDLIDCLGFLRTASCYNVKFLNCQGSNVRNFIYGYVGDRNISRFSQNVVFENCKAKGESNDFLTAINYDVQILSVNEDGSTGVALPAWTNYRHMFRFVNCEFQSGNRLDNASVRFFGCKGKVVFDQCIFRDSYYSLRAEPSANPDYTSIGVLSFRDCLFVNNHQDVSILNCEGVKFEDCRFEDQNPSATLVWQMLNTAPGTTFSRCRWTGKGNASPNWIFDVSSSQETRWYDNTITLLSTAHYAIRNTDSRMKGFGNVCNGQLVNRAAAPPGQLSVYGIVGEISSMYRDMNGVAATGGSTITYEKGAVYEVSTTESLGRIIGGQVGDTVRFRAVAGGANVTFTHLSGGVPIAERLVNTSNATDNPTGALWSRAYQKFDGGWYQV